MVRQQLGSRQLLLPLHHCVRKAKPAVLGEGSALNQPVGQRSHCAVMTLIPSSTSDCCPLGDSTCSTWSWLLSNFKNILKGAKQQQCRALFLAWPVPQPPFQWLHVLALSPLVLKREIGIHEQTAALVSSPVQGISTLLSAASGLSSLLLHWDHVSLACSIS